MKTQVIQLEPYDDVISVRDKMSWAKTDRILLVIPRRSKILARILDMRLLQRHADLVGAQLAIVTRNIRLRLIAKEMEIPVFSRLSTAKRKNWQAPHPPHMVYQHNERPDLRQMRGDLTHLNAGWQDRPVYRFLFFTLAVLAILAVLLTFFPSAVIQLAPSTRLQTLTFKASASSGFTAVNLAGNLPSRSTSVIIEHTRSVPATGLIAIPHTRAVGTAQFRNLTTVPVGITAGTVISTQTHPMVRFVTTTTGQVAAGVGKTVDLPVMAVEAGSRGNLPVDSLVAIQGDLGTRLAVTNSKLTTGGSDQTAAIQTAFDRMTLHASLMADILDECKKELQQTLLPGDIFFPGSLAGSQVLAETYFPAEGQAGDTLSLTLRLKCQAQFARSEDVSKLIEMLLNVNMPEGYIPVSGGLVVQPTSAPVTDSEGITRWDQQVQRLLQVRLEPLNVEQIVLGHHPAVAVRLLNRSLPLAGSPVIQVFPGWWPWLPLIPFRITVYTVP